MAEINEEWVKTEMSGGVELPRSTFNRHKDAIEDIFGIYIDCDRLNGYKYYIGNENVLRENTVQNWMLSTLSVNNLMSESLSLQKRILLEPVSYADEYLPTVMEAMKRNVRIEVLYKKYGDEEPRALDFEPYCLKMFRQRWYILGHFHRDASAECEEVDYFGVFAFDRIKEMRLTDVRFEMDPEFDAATYFSDSFGVLVHDDTLLERVVIRAYGYERYYLRDLPLHSSQREIEEGEDYADFELQLRPTIDFSAHLLSKGSQIKVLSPQWLAEEIHEMHAESANIYEPVP